MKTAQLIDRLGGPENVAHLCGVSRRAVEYWQSGDRSPPPAAVTLMQMKVIGLPVYCDTPCQFDSEQVVDGGEVSTRQCVNCSRLQFKRYRGQWRNALKYDPKTYTITHLTGRAETL